jgi:hypothetical protein
VGTAGAGGGAESGDLFVEESAGVVDVDVPGNAGDLMHLCQASSELHV